MSQAPQSSSLVSGELPPNLPEHRENLKEYIIELDRYNRQLLDYIRRLSSKIAAAQVIQQQALVDWQFDASSGKFQVKSTIDADWVDADGDQPVTVTQAITDVNYDTSSHVLSKNEQADLLVLKKGGTTSAVTIDTAVNTKC